MLDLCEEDDFLNHASVNMIMPMHDGTLTDAYHDYLQEMLPVDDGHLNPDAFEEDDEIEEEIDEIRTTQRLARREAKVSSQLVADVVVAVKQKVLGNLPDTQANRDVVEKNARKIMKDAGITAGDANAQVDAILNVYFSCTSEGGTSGRKRKTVRPWLLRALGFRVPTTSSD